MSVVCIYIVRKNIDVNSAESFISKGLQTGFIELGYKCFIISSLNEIIVNFKNTFIIDDICNYTCFEDIEKTKIIRNKGAIFALWVHWPLAVTQFTPIWEEILLKYNNLFKLEGCIFGISIEM